MDKFGQIADSAAYAVVVLGNAQEFELIDLCAALPSEDRRRELLERGFGFIGVIGIFPDGEPRTALAVELDALTISALSQAFTHRVERLATEVERQAMGDSLHFLEHLYRLPDRRGN